MKNSLILLIAIGCSLYACKAGHNKQSNPPKNVQDSKTEQVSVYPTEPGTCIVQGYVSEILPVDTAAQSEICKSLPCMARVVITQCRSCGFGVPLKPAVGDTLNVNFIYSLLSSNEYRMLYPTKVILPGIKTEQLLEAQIKIKLLLGDQISYQIAEYELLR
jgi:hypothetical protein